MSCWLTHLGQFSSSLHEDHRVFFRYSLIKFTFLSLLSLLLPIPPVLVMLCVASSEELGTL
jgi:hypothetical protein